MCIYLQAWLDKMKMIELQNIVAAKDAELNEDGDTLNLKVNSKVILTSIHLKIN